MTFEQLWAPWRIGYITGGDKAPSKPQPAQPLAWLPDADQNCFLCRAAAEVYADEENQTHADQQNLVVCRNASSLAVLNRYPYNNGHVLVAPQGHVSRLDALSDAQHIDLMRLMSRLCGVLQKSMQPEGFNIGLNLGRVAGAGLPGHLHWHIVPRWNGDTNFMPVLAGVNVIPQSLDALMELLHAELTRSDP